MATTSARTNGRIVIDVSASADAAATLDRFFGDAADAACQAIERVAELRRSVEASTQVAEIDVGTVVER
jgi:hypothetical protein